MKNTKEKLLTFLNCGMEMCWLYAWADFSCRIVMRRSFSFFGALTVFTLSVILVHFTKDRGWRRIYLAITHGLGIGTSCLMIVYSTVYLSYSLFDKAWLNELFIVSKAPLEWFSLAVLFFWSIVFWFSGRALSKRLIIYFSICTRFDMGICAFFCLFLIKLLMLVKGVNRIDDISFAMIFPFFFSA